MFSQPIIGLFFRSSPSYIASFIVTARINSINSMFWGRLFTNLVYKFIKRFKKKLNTPVTISMVFIISNYGTPSFGGVIRVIFSSTSHTMRMMRKLFFMKTTTTTSVSIFNRSRTNNFSIATRTSPFPFTRTNIFYRSKPTISFSSNIYKFHTSMVLYIENLIKFYGTILYNFGYTIESLVVWHWSSTHWEKHVIQFVPIKDYISKKGNQ